TVHQPSRRPEHTHLRSLQYVPALSCSSFLFFQSSCPLLALHSFPTRRSSDLTSAGRVAAGAARGCGRAGLVRRSGRRTRPARPRSEEHTSELQSRFDLVCRLLLEKKKKKTKTKTI